MLRGRPDYELVDHTADTGIVVRAESLPRVFEAAAAAMFDVMYDVTRVDPRGPVRRVELREPDLESALRAWLAELLSWSMAEGLAPGLFDVERVDRAGDGVAVEGSAGAEPLEPGRHRFETEIKAVTWHGIRVEREGEAWRARVIFDV